MGLNDFLEIIKIFNEFGLGLLVGGGIAFAFLKSYFPKYLSEKATNLAKKEDIAAITEEIERVRSSYGEFLEEIKADNQIRVSAEDRKKHLKQEVYLEALEAATKIQGLVSSLSSFNVSLEQAAELFAEYTSQVIKVQLVADEGTVKASNIFLAKAVEVWLSLTIDKGEIVALTDRINLIMEFRDRTSREVDGRIAIMKELNLKGVVDKEVWSNVNLSYEVEMADLKDHNQEIDRLTEHRNNLQLNFTEKSIDRSFYLHSFVPDFLLSARDELGLVISHKAYKEESKAHSEKGKEYLKEFVSKLRAELNRE